MDVTGMNRGNITVSCQHNRFKITARSEDNTTMTDEYQKTAIMFVDVEGSTKLYERLGDQQAQQLIERCLNIVSDIVRQSEGSIVKFIGDEVMCRFADEDSAVEAACKIQEALESKAEKSVMAPIPRNIKGG